VINGAASAVSPAKAYALARGIYVANAGATTSSVENPLLGSIDNEGTINVLAIADGHPLIPGGPPGTTFTFGGSSAFATGILVFAGGNNLTITNSGSILVDAVAKNGDTALAMGIGVLGNGSTDTNPDDVLTINNKGAIIVRQSNDGGKTWERGLAIDVAGAPDKGVPAELDKTVINLLGGGNIYGDIALRAAGDDVINVAQGETSFDGIINPNFLPAGGITGSSLDSGLAGVGTLNIEDGGTLYLRDRKLDSAFASMYDGPSYAFVDTLSIAKGGTVALDLEPASGGAQAVGSYSQIFANTADLGGTLEARITTATGLFENDYSWDNVIDANVVNGEFDSCALGGAYAKSVLLSLQCHYDEAGNVDLSLTRNAFGSISGLNGNGIEVGSSLEGIYNVGLTGGLADMFHDLFLISDPAHYNVALNELSGSVYANYLNSFPSLGVHYDDLTDHATECEIPMLGGSVLECRTSPIHVWGQLDYQTRKTDKDIEGGSGRSKGFTGLMGIDTKVGEAGIAGIDGGYVSNHLRDHQFGDEAKGDGWQVGAYALYDPGSFFLKGVTTYSSFSGDSSRTVNFSKLATGAKFGGRISGDPDVTMWTAGLHGGTRFSLSTDSVVTAYLDYDYVRAKLNGFTESGLDGANLDVEGGSSNHSFLSAGAKWTTRLGSLVPEANLGYRYRFGNTRSTFTACFDDAADCSFTVDSTAQKKGAFLAGLSVGGKLGPVDVSVGYEGEFGGGATSHSGNFKFVLPLGGHSGPSGEDH
jgi:uncharacterized protein with beta-barrel porin domain